MTQEPSRLSDDPRAPELARALREAQGDVLSPEAVARVQSALMASGLAAAGGASAGGLWAGLRSPMAKLLAGSTGLRVGLVGLGLVGLGLAGVASMRHTQGPPASPIAPPDQAIATPGAAPMEQGSSLPPAGGPVLPTVDTLPADVPTAMTVEAARARPPVSSTPARPTPRPAAQSAVPSPREGALLLQARRALGTDPARALALVRAHEQEFPESQLGPERARIAAEARQRLEK